MRARAFIVATIVLALSSQVSAQDGMTLWGEFMDGVGTHFAGNNAAIKNVLIGAGVLLVLALNVLVARRMIRGAASPGEVSIQRVRELVHQGQKIQAIKMYRELTGVGLAEAKAAVEAGV